MRSVCSEARDVRHDRAGVRCSERKLLAGDVCSSVLLPTRDRAVTSVRPFCRLPARTSVP